MKPAAEAVTVAPESSFGRHLTDAIRKAGARRIIETGTFVGMGTTAIIARALAECRLGGARFYTIECNPEHYRQALENLRTSGLLSLVQPLHGVTVPRALLPTADAVARECVAALPAGCEFVDHAPEERVARYIEETAFDDTPDDLLRYCLREFDYRPDMVLLDSAGHMGFVEFQYLIEHLRGPCLIALDDVLHLKHCRSLSHIKADDRFRLLVESDEKFGFCIAQFTPAPAPVSISAASSANRPPETRESESRPLRIAIALVEHFGDIVACEPIVGHLRREFPDAHITWIVRPEYRELIDTHPEIDETLTVGCLTEWMLLRQSGLFDRIFDLHFQQRICADCGVPLVKLEDESGVTLQNYYAFGPLLHAFCRAGGVPVLDETPHLYIPPSAVLRVDMLNLPDSFVAVHCRSNETARDWTAEAWNGLARHLAARGHAIVEIGSGTGVLRPEPGMRLISLLGVTSLLETAEVIRRARLFVGIDSGPAHFANAVGTPGVIILGKYHAFDCYLPYSGAYGSGGVAEIVYAESGPAAAVTVDAVCAAADRRLTTCASAARSGIDVFRDGQNADGRPSEQLVRALERRRVRSVVAKLHVPGSAASKAAASAGPSDSDLMRSLDRDDLGAEQRERLTAATIERHLTGLYNIASWLAKHERTAEAHQLFSSVASTARRGHPALAGRAHFKLAELALNGDERIAQLTQCVALYPEHREATRQLADVVPTA